MIAYGFNCSPLQYDLLLSQDSLFRKFFPKIAATPLIITLEHEITFIDSNKNYLL